MEKIINRPEADPRERLEALREYVRKGPPQIRKTEEVNNHIHTIYSFSPYTPSMAALQAWRAGLSAAGSVDHDSIAGAEELLAACGDLGLGGCTGFEVRVSFKTDAEGRPGPFRDRKINNPDSLGLAYMTVQGVPKPARAEIQAFLAPLRAARLERTRQMTDSANVLLAEAGLEELDFSRDVMALSQYSSGGGITERHLLSAAAGRLIRKYGKGPGLTEGLKSKLQVKVSGRAEKNLGDPGNIHYLFDLLGVLKADFLPRIFIQPGETECLPAKAVTDFANRLGGVPCYAYLGDVEESPTGDKKAERFEDAYLEELFGALLSLGYRGVTYMPPRNTPEQIRRVQGLCAEAGLMEISGVDINSSRQSFNCPEVLAPECRHLTDTTWALIAHERLASADPALGLFSLENPRAGGSLGDRLRVYSVLGRALDPRRAEESAEKSAKKLREGL